MYTKTSDRVEVVYTGPMTHASDRNNAELTGPDRWVRKGTKGLQTGAHTAVVSLRGFSGREMARLVYEANRADGVYDAIAAAAEITAGPVRHTDDLTLAAAVGLWSYACAMTRGEDPEDESDQEPD